MSGASDGNGKSGKRQPLLSAEDAALWEFVARRIAPAKGKSRVRDFEPDTSIMARSVAEVPPPLPKRPSTAPEQVVRRPPPPKPAPPPPQPVTLERRKARRIAKGTEEIEARLDLHGMTQADAHDALIGFVRRCHANGCRTVLVITGKGGTRGSHDEGDDVVPRHRGVLKRNVPQWLASPDIGGLVVSYTTAHIRHGGEGALYVRLRRNS